MIDALSALACDDYTAPEVVYPPPFPRTISVSVILLSMRRRWPIGHASATIPPMPALARRFARHAVARFSFFFDTASIRCLKQSRMTVSESPFRSARPPSFSAALNSL